MLEPYLVNFPHQYFPKLFAGNGLEELLPAVDDVSKQCPNARNRKEQEVACIWA